VTLPVSALARTGSVFASGGVNFDFALVGASELADTGRGFRHYRHNNNVKSVLRL
jgi:hypothetical protein